MTVIQQQLMSVEEYLKFEETSELRHEYINGQLIKMPGEKDINTTITVLLTVFFFSFLSKKGYKIYYHAIKVGIPNEKRFYYPDWMITKEAENGSYIKNEPELLVEVLSKTSRTRDMVDKYLDYIKIPTLKYYLIIDPDRVHVTVHSKSENGEWESEAYSKKSDVILLPLLQTKLPLKVVYPK